MRPVVHHYSDPLDHIWSVTAHRIGLRVERSDEVYASIDGRGTMRIGTDDTLDADDCLAQMIFHELCHSLIEGPDAFARPDWGLDNTSTRDDVREHACLRLQATLAAEYGLRKVLAPTTDFRAFYDQLPDDALRPRHLPSVVLAVLGWQRVEHPPWAPHLRAALQATAAVASAAAAFEGPGPRPLDPAGRRALWLEVEPPLERHPVGFAVARGDQPERSCGTCSWSYRGGRGRAVERCRQADGARIELSWPACERWEGPLDCQDCGACCREAYHSVTVGRRDPAVTRHPELMVERENYIELRRRPTDTGTRCAALDGGRSSERGWQPFQCTIYETRPRPCREFENGGPHCLTARRRVGASR